MDKSTHPALSISHPRLWWPNGYGEQNLYDLTLRFVRHDGRVSDTKTARIGIRKFIYHTGAPLTFYCNGRRIMVKGANWGMDEGMIRCDRQGYETRLRLEKDMNFTMIRNCLGNVSKDDFFDLCDQYGLMVWEEFGSNHNAVPFDIGMFIDNARDRLLARRNHACVAIWCTANEGGPCKTLQEAIPPLVQQLDGTRHFLQHSTLRPPTVGDGPYETINPRFYFQLADGFRAEIGSPVVPSLESMRRMMPHNQLWPIGDGWAAHDWTYGYWAPNLKFTRNECLPLVASTGAKLSPNGSAEYCRMTERAIAAYGDPTGIADLCRKAQMVHMETFKAIFEGWNDRMSDKETSDGATGVMLWMSNPAWPSLAWNTYDYYLEPTGAYYGSKRGCEPIHIQWNMATGTIKVVNNTLSDLKQLCADARVLNLDGTQHRRKTVVIDCPANSLRKCFDLSEADSGKAKAIAADGLSKVYFIKLDLKDRAGTLLSEEPLLAKPGSG